MAGTNKPQTMVERWFCGFLTERTPKRDILYDPIWTLMIKREQSNMPQLWDAQLGLDLYCLPIRNSPFIKVTFVSFILPHCISSVCQILLQENVKKIFFAYKYNMFGQRRIGRGTRPFCFPFSVTQGIHLDIICWYI